MVYEVPWSSMILMILIFPSKLAQQMYQMYMTHIPTSPILATTWTMVINIIFPIDVLLIFDLFDRYYRNHPCRLVSHGGTNSGCSGGASKG